MDIKFFGGPDAGILDSLLAVIFALGLYIFRGVRSDLDATEKKASENAGRLSHIEGFLQAQTGKFRKLRSGMEE